MLGLCILAKPLLMRCFVNNAFFEIIVDILEVQKGVVGTVVPEVVSNLNVIMKRHARMIVRLTLTTSCLNVNLMTDCIVR